MIVAVPFVDIIAFAGIEHEIHAFIQQIKHMAVYKLGGITNRIGRNGVLPRQKQFARRLVGYNGFESQRIENRVPERKLLVKIKT